MTDQIEITYPPNLELLTEVAISYVATASDGTDRFAAMNVLVDQGLLQKNFCPKAGGVHQFQLTRAGLEAIQ